MNFLSPPKKSASGAFHESCGTVPVEAPHALKHCVERRSLIGSLADPFGSDLFPALAHSAVVQMKNGMGRGPGSALMGVNRQADPQRSARSVGEDRLCGETLRGWVRQARTRQGLREGTARRLKALRNDPRLRRHPTSADSPCPPHPSMQPPKPSPPSDNTASFQSNQKETSPLRRQRVEAATSMGRNGAYETAAQAQPRFEWRKGRFR